MHKMFLLVPFCCFVPFRILYWPTAESRWQTLLYCGLQNAKLIPLMARNFRIDIGLVPEQRCADVEILAFTDLHLHLREFVNKHFSENCILQLAFIAYAVHNCSEACPCPHAQLTIGLHLCLSMDAQNACGSSRWCTSVFQNLVVFVDKMGMSELITQWTCDVITSGYS